MNVDMIFAIIF